MLKPCSMRDCRNGGRTQIEKPTASREHSSMKTTTENTKDSGSRIRRGVSFHMTRLIDQWSFNAICFLIFLKLLQLCKLLGAKPTENGWRKVTGIFLKGDISKFMLGIFRVTPYPAGSPPENMKEASGDCIAQTGIQVLAAGDTVCAIQSPGFSSAELTRTHAP